MSPTALALAAALAASAPPAEPAPVNPLLQPWPELRGGVPPFAQVRLEHFAPAIEAAMAEQLAAVERIAAEVAPPTFENTIVALERSERTLDRVLAVYGVWASALSTPAFQALEREVQPRLAAMRDRIAQNARLFARVEAVYQARERSGLGPEQQRLAWLVRTGFVRAGARLDAAAKARVAAINQELASRYTAFAQNVLAEEAERALLLTRETDLAGLSPAQRSAAAAAAEERGQKGKWAILATRSAVEPFLSESTRRDLREAAWRMFKARGDGGAHDNRPGIAAILALRGERARLLGYPTHAHWRVEDSMARTPERALSLMEQVWPAAVARVRQEVADMQAVADREAARGGPRIAIEPWDYLFYAEKVRRERYDLDEAEVKSYLQLEKLREAMFWVAGQLFGLRFVPAPDVPVYHPEVRAWEVVDGEGRHVGVWYFDPYARTGKQSGAWADSYRKQEGLDGPVGPVISNNCNYLRGAPGEPVLVSWTDAETLFHEFGHALHGLLSRVTYASLSGTSVPADYVEFPSQILERWLPTPEVLGRFATHVRTGAPMPEALVRKIERARRFNQGYQTVEYLSAALVDLKIHLAPGPVEPGAFEREALAALGMPREVALRHRLPHFQHVFTNDGYAAGYYSYLWADVISADAFEAFTEAGGPYDRPVAARLQRFVLGAGNSLDPAEGYRLFRGRDPDVAALMRGRGFPVGPSASGAGPAGGPSR